MPPQTPHTFNNSHTRTINSRVRLDRAVKRSDPRLLFQLHISLSPRPTHAYSSTSAHTLSVTALNGPTCPSDPARIRENTRVTNNKTNGFTWHQHAALWFCCLFCLIQAGDFFFLRGLTETVKMRAKCSRISQLENSEVISLFEGRAAAVCV